MSNEDDFETNMDVVEIPCEVELNFAGEKFKTTSHFQVGDMVFLDIGSVNFLLLEMEKIVTQLKGKVIELNNEIESLKKAQKPTYRLSAPYDDMLESEIEEILSNDPDLIAIKSWNGLKKEVRIKPVEICRFEEGGLRYDVPRSDPAYVRYDSIIWIRRGNRCLLSVKNWRENYKNQEMRHKLLGIPVKESEL